LLRHVLFVITGYRWMDILLRAELTCDFLSIPPLYIDSTIT
jgi:hypothetical protein